jgi:4'-phosphopantetheinyl transferase
VPDATHQSTSRSTAVVPLGFVREGAPVPAFLACVNVEAVAGLADSPEELLHPHERLRLASYPTSARRTSYLLGRYAAKLAVCALREGACGPPDRVEIASGVFGQPIVRDTSGDPPRVSLSHTTRLGVAVACNREQVITVDLEEIRPDRFETFVSVTTVSERAALTEVTSNDALAVNIIWSVKESLAKALRCGLMTPFELLETAEHDLRPDGGTSCRFPNFPQYRGTAWTVAGHVLAVVSPKRSVPGPAPASLARLDAVMRHRAIAGSP